MLTDIKRLEMLGTEFSKLSLNLNIQHKEINMAGSTIWAPVGDKGPTGDQGPPGPQGPVGPQGAPGPDAAAFNAFVAALQANGGDALVGHVAGATVQQKFTQLDGQITALQSGGSGQVAVVTHINELKTLDKTKLSYAVTKGYYVAGDNGAGAYWIDLTDTTSVDNGGTIIVALDGGRWKLIHNSSVHIEQFGAKADNFTNLAPYMNAAITAAGIREVRLGAGPYALGIGIMQMPVGMTISGIPGAGTTINVFNAPLFVMRSLCTFSGVKFHCDNQNAGSYLFLLATSLGSMEYVNISDIITYSCKGFIYDEATPSNIATNIRIKNISCRLHKGPGIVFSDVFAFLECRDIAFDYVGNVAPQNFTAVSISNNEGCLLDNVEVSGGQVGSVGGVTAAQVGFAFGNSKAIYLKRCFADTLGGRGFTFTSCQFIRMVMCSAPLCNDVGVAVLSSTDFQATNLYVQGRRGLGTAAAGIPGVLFNGGSRFHLNGFNINSATGDGINTNSAATSAQISNGESWNNVGRGLVTNAGSLSITSNVLFASNSGGNYFLSTAFDHLTGCQSNSGALLNVTGPANA